jgi:HK97 family phage prohead protease
MEVLGMKNNELQRRSYAFEVRADKDDQGGNIITGRPIVYDKMTDLGWFDEIIERGALDKTNLQDVRFLVNHDTSKIPLARSRKNNKNSTMQLTVDNDGMAIRVTLDTENNADARSLYSAVQRGDISGMSFMFSIDDEEWENLDSDHPTRHIRKIGTVVEVSAVTFPAYEQTEISTRCKETLDSARQAVDTARQQRGEVDTSKLELEKLKAKYLYNL